MLLSRLHDANNAFLLCFWIQMPSVIPSLGHQQSWKGSFTTGYLGAMFWRPVAIYSYQILMQTDDTDIQRREHRLRKQTRSTLHPGHTWICLTQTLKHVLPSARLHFLARTTLRNQFPRWYSAVIFLPQHPCCILRTSYTIYVQTRRISKWSYFIFPGLRDSYLIKCCFYLYLEIKF